MTIPSLSRRPTRSTVTYTTNTTTRRWKKRREEGYIITHHVYNFDQQSASLHRLIPIVYVGVKPGYGDVCNDPTGGLYQ